MHTIISVTLIRKTKNSKFLISKTFYEIQVLHLTFFFSEFYFFYEKFSDYYVARHRRNDIAQQTDKCFV